MEKRRIHGFTVVEVFLVIALLAIVVGLMVVPAQRIAASLHVRPIEAMVLSAVRDAHIQARKRNVPVSLRYLSETNRLQLSTLDGTLIQEIEIEHGSDADSAPLSFYRLLPEDPKREETAYEAETDPVASITFHPSGASTPFAVEIEDGRKMIRLVMDPFSCEPVLREEEK